MTTRGASGKESFWIDEDNSLWRSDDARKTFRKVQCVKKATNVAGCAMQLVVIGENGFCWGIGFNHDGQLSVETFTYTNGFERISVIDNVVEVAVGQHITVFLDNNGTVWACGKNSCIQIVENFATKVSSPAIVSNLPPCQAICAGPECIFALDKEGSVWLSGSSLAINKENWELPLQNSNLKRILFAKPIEFISVGETSGMFSSVDGRVLWRCTSSDTIQCIFENGIKQIAETMYRSVVLDNAGILWIWHEGASEFQQSLMPDNQQISYFHSSTTAELMFLCTTDGDYFYIYPEYGADALKLPLTLPFVPLPPAFINKTIQKKSA